MIYYTIPFNSEKNIGKYYNDFIKIVPNDDDWICFVDGDTIFTTHDYGVLIEKVIKENPEASCFTSLTNRVACKWQIAPGVDVKNNDISYHRNYGENLMKLYGSSVVIIDKKRSDELFSGFFILIKKSTWSTIGGFKEEKMLGVDNDLHLRLNKNNLKFYQMKGLYLYHWYRGGNKKDKLHLL